jgi:hypothetical protein
MVSVALKQVPEYQIGSGIDQAGASTGGQALDSSKFTNSQADKQAGNIAKNGKNTPSTAGANNGTDPNKNPPKVEDLDPNKRAY